MLAAADLALRLKALTREGLTVNPARIDGGSPNNVVPDHAVLRVNLRPHSPELEEFALAEIRALITALLKLEHDVSIHLHGGFQPSAQAIDLPRPKSFSVSSKACGEDLGLTIGWKSTGGVCDGNNIAACGVSPWSIPWACAVAASTAATNILITESLVERARLSALTLICGSLKKGGYEFHYPSGNIRRICNPCMKWPSAPAGGFTNLPPDRKALTAKLERSAEGFARTGDGIGDDLFVFVLENRETREVRGTCQIFSAVGQKWPFYSYRIGALTQHSVELESTFRADILNLSTDLEGATEVGGLFLHPGERSGGLGMLIARSRYLFIRNHRARFADRTLAELRGVIDEAGGSPFWDGVAGRFFGMNFQDADEFNAKHLATSSSPT